MKRRKKINPFTVPELNSSQILSLAREVAEGKIFGSWMINGCSKDVAGQVFPIILTDTKHKFEIGLFDTPNRPPRYTDADSIVHVFQYVKKQILNKKGPYPLFLNCYGLKRKFAMTLTNAIKGIQSGIS